MNFAEFTKALGVAVFVLVLTLAASFPMFPILIDIPLSSFFTAAILLSLVVKVIAAFWGANLGFAGRSAPD